MSTTFPHAERQNPATALSDAVLVVDRAGAIVEANHVAGRMFGYGREDLLGRPIEDLIPVSLRAAHAAQRQTKAGPQVRKMGQARPFPALSRDGTELLVEIGLMPGYRRPGAPGDHGHHPGCNGP